MNKIRSLANNPRLDKHEKPNSANVKKKIPVKTIKNKGKEKQFIKKTRTQPILETCNIIPETKRQYLMNLT